MKEKLLTLINACLDNENFYNLNANNKNEESIILSHISGYLTKSIQTDSSSHDNCKSWDMNQFAELRKQFPESGNNANFTSHSRMTIKFIDQPEIKICINYTAETKTLGEFEVDEVKHKKKFNLFKENEHLWIPTGYEIKCKVNETIYSHFYVINSGTIKEQISVEEFGVLSKKYNDNKERLERKFDENRINERLEKYK